MTKIGRLILEARYLLLELDGWNDRDIKLQLDGWLEDWLFRKNRCPACGAKDEI